MDIEKREEHMTAGQKAGKTIRERKVREEEQRAAAIRDREQAIAICRRIRDDENAADADRLEAIRLLGE